MPKRVVEKAMSSRCTNAQFNQGSSGWVVMDGEARGKYESMKVRFLSPCGWR